MSMGNNPQKISTTAVGIDLGTTFSSVAFLKDGKPEVIGDCNFGEHLVPSAVFYAPNNTDLNVGKYAETFSVRKRSNYVYDIKRLMGRKYDDVYVQELIANGKCSYKIVEGSDGDVAVEVMHNNKIVKKSPEEISCDILKFLKKSACKELGKSEAVEMDAVISVPAHFNNAQRKATREAAKMAGFNVLKLISEPVAAAIHYCMNILKTTSKLLIFDFGGGTLDVSVIDAGNHVFDVKAIEGNSFLGGRDVDKNLENHFFPEIIAKMESKSENYRNEHLLRVKRECIKMKNMLSIATEVHKTLDYFEHEKKDLPLVITREKFNELNENLFNNAIDLVSQCLHDLDLSAEDIDQIVLVGGSTRIPKIQEMLESKFGKNKLKTDLNPDEAIVLGAAIQAALLKEKGTNLERFAVTELAPLSIGIELNGGLMKTVINKNTKLPVKVSAIIVTSENNQKHLLQKIFEGERKNCRFNMRLGSITLKDLSPGRAGDVSTETVLNLDENGILTVEVWEIVKDIKAKAVFTLIEHRRSQNKIKACLEDAVRFKEEDEIFEKLINYRRDAKDFCCHVLHDLKKILNDETRNTVKRLCDDFLRFAEDATNIEIFDELKETFQNCKKQIDPLIKDLIEVEIKVD